jgi:xanthosine utilization system XapX-like protein
MPVPAPPNGGGRHRAIAVVAGIAGLVVGAAVVGGAWLLFGNNGSSSSPISAPARLGEHYRFADVPALRGEDQTSVTRQRNWDHKSSEQLSTSHDGAGAVVQQYADKDLENMFALEAVRSPSPPALYVPYTDPKDLGTDKPMEEVLTFGDVSCAVRNLTEGTPSVMRCERTDGALTVAITHVGGDLAEHPRDVATLVDEAWSQLT